MRSKRALPQRNEPHADLVLGWTSQTVDGPTSRLSVLFLLTALYYLSYRYPLQINSSGTSPTYADTPPAFQVAKYVIWAALVFLLLLHNLATLGSVERRRVHPVLILTLGLLGLWPIIQGALYSDIGIFESGIYFLFPLVLLLFGAARVDPFRISRTIFIFAIVAISVEVIQLVLFLSVGRLPALAYAGTYSVRFGSIWDDPNGFGFVIALLIPFGAIYLRRWRSRLTLLAALIGLLVLTQSITAITSSLVASLMVWFFHLRTSAGRLVAAIYGVAIIAIAIGFAVGTSGFFQVFFRYKTASVSGHLSSFDPLRNAGLAEIIGWAPTSGHGESGYLNMLLGSGIVFVIAYALLLLVIVARGLRRMSEVTSPPAFRAIHAGLAGFSMSVFLGLGNLPLELIFPVNALVAFAAAMSWSLSNCGVGPAFAMGGSR